MLLSNKLKLSVAVMSLVVVAEAFASNNNNDMDENGKRIVSVVPAAESQAQDQNAEFRPHTWYGRLGYNWGLVSEETIRSKGESWWGYQYAPKKVDADPVEEMMEDFEHIPSGAEIDAAIAADEELKAAEEAAAETIYDANVRFVVRCTVEAYGDDYDELTREEIGYLVEGYHKGNLGGAYEQLREAKKRDSMSLEEKVKNMSEQVKPTVVEVPKPKTALGWFASYLISERAVVAVGRKLGYTYGDEAKPVEVVAPVNKASASVLSTEEEKILRTFAGLTEENQKRVMLAIENGSLAQLIMDTSKPNNGDEEVSEDLKESAAVPAAPMFVPVAPKAPVVATAVEGRGALLDQIKAGKALKKTAPKQGSDSESSEDSQSDIVNSLAQALSKMRSAHAGNDNNNNEDDGAGFSDDE